MLIEVDSSPFRSTHGTLQARGCLRLGQVKRRFEELRRIDSAHGWAWHGLHWSIDSVRRSYTSDMSFRWLTSGPDGICGSSSDSSSGDKSPTIATYVRVHARNIEVVWLSSSPS